MGRPRKRRRVCKRPEFNSFGPINHQSNLTSILTLEEYEVVRLIDFLGQTQEEASVQLGVSRATIQSIYQEARFKISDSLVNGKFIKIEGGDYILCNKKCLDTCVKNKN